MIKLILHGCNGKMGQTVVGAANTNPDIRIVAGIDKYSGNKSNPFPVYERFSDMTEQGDVILDFSSPSALPDLLEYAGKSKTPLVIATTGLSERNMEQIRQASKEIAIFQAANMAMGVNLMYELVNQAASVLGERFDIEIIEKHHNQKADSPSGTAYSLAEAANKAFLNSRHYVYGRHSKSDKRSKDEIGIHSIRGGTIAGEHSVLFAGPDETLEITHQAQSKQIFALGALTAVQYLAGKKTGLYNMKDIMLDQNAVTNIHTNNEEAMITVNCDSDDPTFAAKIFGKLAQQDIVIDLISQTVPENGGFRLSFTLPQQEQDHAMQILEKCKVGDSSVKANTCSDITRLTVEGPGMERQPGVAAKVFEIMAEQDIRVKMISTSETKIAVILPRQDEKRAVESILEAFHL